ncbi:MAG: amidohydrolase/deacetylase family metallohydrolase [Balneolales bacterium]
MNRKLSRSGKTGVSDKALHGRPFFMTLFLMGMLTVQLSAQPYDLLIKGGHVIDPKNRINEPMDIAVNDGVVAKVSADIPATDAAKVVDATGHFVAPGFIDMHAHVFFGSTPRNFADGSYSVAPDNFSFRAGVTTVVDAGDSGWRNFPVFKEQVIDPSRTRVLVFLNIVGHGLRGDPYNNNFSDMDVEKTLSMIQQYPDIIVGSRIGHIRQNYWEPFEKAMEVAQLADMPMLLECNLPELELEKTLASMRPGDIFAHAHQTGRRSLMDDQQNRIYDFVNEAREKGIIFDVSHGGTSFRFSQAIAAIEQGFYPDTFGTDLHFNSRNSGMKNMLNVMSKFLNMGMSLEDVILRATWNAATALKREDLGHLSEGAVADIAVFKINHGNFGFVDVRGYRMDGDRKLVAELTLREGRIVWDLNGLAAPLWNE